MGICTKKINSRNRCRVIILDWPCRACFLRGWSYAGSIGQVKDFLRHGSDPWLYQQEIQWLAGRRCWMWISMHFPRFSRLSHFFPHNHRLGYLLLIRDLSLKTLKFLCFIWVPEYHETRDSPIWGHVKTGQSPQKIPQVSAIFQGRHWGLPEVPGPGDLQHVHWRVGWPMGCTDHHRSRCLFPPNFDEMRKGIHTHTHCVYIYIYIIIPHIYI